MTRSPLSRSRLWILGCAVGSFATGVSTGLALPEVFAACSADRATTDPNEQYVQRLGADLGLAANQLRMLRIVQQRLDSELLALLRETSVDQLPPELQRALKKARRRLRDRMNVVFTDEQRVRFEEMIKAQGRGEVR